MKLRLVIILLLAIAGISSANAHVKFEGVELKGGKQQFTDQLIQKVTIVYMNQAANLPSKAFTSAYLVM